MQETLVQFLGREDPLEKEMATHSSTLAWKISRIEEPDRLQSTGSKSDTTEPLSTKQHSFSFLLFPAQIPELVYKFNHLG